MPVHGLWPTDCSSALFTPEVGIFLPLLPIWSLAGWTARCTRVHPQSVHGYFPVANNDSIPLLSLFKVSLTSLLPDFECTGSQWEAQASPTFISLASSAQKLLHAPLIVILTLEDKSPRASFRGRGRCSSETSEEKMLLSPVAPSQCSGQTRITSYKEEPPQKSGLLLTWKKSSNHTKTAQQN